VYTSSGHFVLANTRDFLAGYPYSRHSISVSPIARDASGMQRDDWYSSERVHADLASPEAIGDYAARRALARLGARKLSTRQCPVLFEAPAGVRAARQLRAGSERRRVVSQGVVPGGCAWQAGVCPTSRLRKTLTCHAGPARARSTKKACADSTAAS